MAKGRTANNCLQEAKSGFNDFLLLMIKFESNPMLKPYCHGYQAFVKKHLQVFLSHLK